MQSLVRRKVTIARALPYVASSKDEVDFEPCSQSENAKIFMELYHRGMCHEAQPDVKTPSLCSSKKVSRNSSNSANLDADFVASLRICAQKKDLQKGREIHTDIIRLGLLRNNVFLCSSLVSMYAKCGTVEKAQEVFNELPVQNTVTWNALIAGYVQHEHSTEALKCFERMKAGGFEPDAFTFSCVLRACSSLSVVEMGKEIHEQIAKEGLLGKDIVLANGLIDMYAKCGALDKAHEVFSELPVRNLVSFNALLAGHSQHGYGKEALRLYEQIQSGGFSPSAVTFACTLKACGNVGDLDKGQKLHAHIVKENSEKENIAVANALVDMYAKCGAVAQAQAMFEALPFRNIILWTALISGYAQHGHGKEALSCFKQMQLGGFPPDAVTLSCVLKACSSIGALENGLEIHSQIVREYPPESDDMIANALIDMYAKCGALENAQEVFNKLPGPGVVAWTALIGGYAQHRYGNEALDCFRRMQMESLSPDGVTFACSLKACGSMKDLIMGQQIHSQIVRQRSLEKQLLVFNSLIDMYAKCGALERAQNVFDGLSNRNIVSWNAILSGLIQYGHCRDAITLYEQMLSKDVSPDAATYACILKACSDIGDLDMGQEIHGRMKREHLLEKRIVVANALVDMYAKCGALALAREVFDELPMRDIILWTALITGYVEHGLHEEAISCFEQMQVEGFYPDAVAFASILKACRSMGAAYRGQDIHGEIVKNATLEDDLVVASALVDFYANCGMIGEAHMLFDKLLVQDVVLWSALMVGYAQLGKEDVVLDLFDKMIEEGIKPDTVTFTIILNTCSHRGLLDTGQMYFEMINKVFAILPTVEHYTIMIDLFGRAGHLERAFAVLEKLPVSVTLTMWHTLLGACRKWANMELGMRAFEQLHEVDDAFYVCLSKIFTVAGGNDLSHRSGFASMKEDVLDEPI